MEKEEEDQKEISGLKKQLKDTTGSLSLDLKRANEANEKLAMDLQKSQEEVKRLKNEKQAIESLSLKNAPVQSYLCRSNQ